MAQSLAPQTARVSPTAAARHWKPPRSAAPQQPPAPARASGSLVPPPAPAPHRFPFASVPSAGTWLFGNHPGVLFPGAGLSVPAAHRIADLPKGRNITPSERSPLRWLYTPPLKPYQKRGESQTKPHAQIRRSQVFLVRTGNNTNYKVINF